MISFATFHGTLYRSSDPSFLKIMKIPSLRLTLILSCGCKNRFLFFESTTSHARLDSTSLRGIYMELITLPTIEVLIRLPFLDTRELLLNRLRLIEISERKSPTLVCVKFPFTNHERFRSITSWGLLVGDCSLHKNTNG